MGVDECFDALKHMGKDKAPGWDGLTVEFFISLWDDLKEVVHILVNRAFMENSMERSIKQGLIRLIPKQPTCSALSAQWSKTLSAPSGHFCGGNMLSSVPVDLAQVGALCMS